MNEDVAAENSYTTPKFDYFMRENGSGQCLLYVEGTVMLMCQTFLMAWFSL